ncbi:MAG TPA: AmmeMemoRadiSam system radical SAM enzyme [Syntrophales bacterium]|nr:AmmeMemoRadiSam system radical SAM enzyme [Syntrophales bacterium]HRV43136.1 AmmeMemoRadiSam system radical SAM enzyme [Syntrophales bacterium]
MGEISRRDLLALLGKGALALAVWGVSPPGVFGSLGPGGGGHHRARHWASAVTGGGNCRLCHDPSEGLKGAYEHPAGLVRCLLCPHRCVLLPGQRGRCRARMNVDGELVSLVYGRPVAVHTDPIEKKPFYHFLPGAAAFSLATAGCPLSCPFCQNWQISQARPEDHPVAYTAPETLVRTASAEGDPVIAFTYNEPTVFFEYMVDTAREARRRGIRGVLISCGYINDAPLKELCSVLSAIKIDLKGYSETFYRDVCKAELKPVLKTIKIVARSGVHLEIVNLVVPTLNDSDAMIRGLADWVHGEVGPDVPLHFSRFHPDYRMRHLPPTPVRVLERARAVAMERGLRYVYVGNVPNHPGNHTYCPSCKKVLISRVGFFVLENNVTDGRCRFCRRKIAGVWA